MQTNNRITHKTTILVGLTSTVLIMAVVLSTFYYAHGVTIMDIDLGIPFISLPIFIIGMIAHELLHALPVVVAHGYKSVKVGVRIEALMPYCHYKITLTKWLYATSTLLPAIMLGAVPLIVGYLTTNFFIAFFGGFMLSAGSVDLYMFYKMLKYPKDAKFVDHPTEPGFNVILPSEQESTTV